MLVFEQNVALEKRYWIPYLLGLEASIHVTNSMPLGSSLLPVDVANYAATLKAAPIYPPALA
jgi:hypothetical protein